MLREYWAEVFSKDFESLITEIKEYLDQKNKANWRTKFIDTRLNNSTGLHLLEILSFWKHYFAANSNDKYSEAIQDVFRMIAGENNSLSKKIEHELNDNEFLFPQPVHTMTDLATLPQYSFAIEINFKLRKPYLSRDDRELYIIENPVRKEWVFKNPYIAPSQWKGCLHAAMVSLLREWWESLLDEQKRVEDFVGYRLRLLRLFGNESDIDVNTDDFNSYLDEYGGREAAKSYKSHLERLLKDGRRRGRLHFYPSYFRKIGLEVINRHDRTTGAGTVPVFFECVPEGEKSVFTILYVPFDLVGIDETAIRREAAEDLVEVAKGIKYLLTRFGFGAKTSTAHGLAEEIIEGKILVNGPVNGRSFTTLQEFVEGSSVLAAQLRSNHAVPGEGAVSS